MFETAAAGILTGETAALFPPSAQQRHCVSTRLLHMPWSHGMVVVCDLLISMFLVRDVL
jgi:hypothetical protein